MLSEPGVLTIATSKPSYPPFFADNDPTNGRGFESAVAYAVAEGLGFAPEEVNWVYATPEKTLSSKPKKFDFAIGQYVRTLTRSLDVSFSEPYYLMREAVVTLPSSPAASVTSASDLQKLKLAAASASTSLAYVTQVIQPKDEPLAYDDIASAKSALEAGEVDAIIVDLPTAYSITMNDIPKAKIAGELPLIEGSDRLGLVFEKGDPLTACVDEVLADLADSGRLQALEDEWLAGDVVPELGD
ncbi:MAG: ABC transporter substrate-binding protein [bacterium]